MDEGRLAVVIRQEERHRKSVYMMNDIVRARLGLYTNCLDREQHESTVKLIKNCSHLRRAVVRQKVLRRCLETRKRQSQQQDPSGLYGQYGGKPLWSFSRDMERVMADNHPKLRRLKRVEAAMKHSLESGAILDEEAMARRIQSFFHLKRARQQQQQQQQQQQGKDRPKEGPQMPEVFPATRVLRRNVFKPPSRGTESGTAQETLPSVPTQPERADKPDRSKPDSWRRITRKGKDSPEPDSQRNSDPPVGIVNRVSLELDSRGRLRGIRTKPAEPSQKEEEQKKRLPDIHGDSQKVSGTRAERGCRSRPGRQDPTGSREAVDDWGFNAEATARRQHLGATEDRPRSKLILPPIHTSKALVSQH